ncbi:MAG: hypothetical protein JKX72_10655, partial [Robiginitomaculum sp.]|nr:hypothetical protein [Robiginitomaculum sp.]
MTQTGQKSKSVVSVLGAKNDPWAKMETTGLGIARKLAKLAPRVFLEFMSVVMTLAIFWLGAIGVLMNRQSVDLKFFKPHYEHWFSGAFSGKSADIQTYKAHWIQEKRAIEIRASHIKITGQNGEFQNINEIRGEFTLAPKLLSRPILTTLYVDGGALTVSRDGRGRVQMGLGTPETYEKVGPLWLSKNQIDTSPSAQIDAIATIIVKSADVYFEDQINQFSLTLSDVDGVYENDGETISIQSNGNIWKKERVAPFQLDVKTNLARNSFDINAHVKALYPVDIAPKLGTFAALADLDAPVDLEMKVQVLPGAQLNDLFVKMDVGQGKLKTGKTYKQFDSAHIDARYDAQSQAINIPDFKIESEPVTGNFFGQIKNIGTAELGFFKTPIAFEISMHEGRINPGEKYSGPILLGESKIKGTLDFVERSINFDAFNVDFGSFQTNLKIFAQRLTNGKLSALKIGGPILGTVSPQQILSLWPNDVAL